jgi:hypothetical protein
MNDLERRIWKIFGRKQTAPLATVTVSGSPWVADCAGYSLNRA